MSTNITFVAAEHRPIALRLLFARFPVDEQQQRINDTLRSVEQGRLNLDGLLLATENDQPVGAALTMHQSDGVTLVWPPVITCQTTDVTAVEDGLMIRLCDEIDQAGSQLAQVLMAPDDVAEIELLGRHGFEHAADMYFLARPLTSDDLNGTPNNGEFDHETFRESNCDRFASVVERT